MPATSHAEQIAQILRQIAERESLGRKLDPPVVVIVVYVDRKASIVTNASPEFMQEIIEKLKIYAGFDSNSN